MAKKTTKSHVFREGRDFERLTEPKLMKILTGKIKDDTEFGWQSPVFSLGLPISLEKSRHPLPGETCTCCHEDFADCTCGDNDEDEGA